MNTKSLIYLVMVALCLAACQKQQDQIVVVRDGIAITQDGMPYTSPDRLLYIYEGGGAHHRFAQYNPFSKFFLPEGQYMLFAAPPTCYIPAGCLDTMVIRQDTAGLKDLIVSDWVRYTPGQAKPVNLDMRTRMGQLVITSTDTKADKRYNKVVFELKCKRSGYSVFANNYVDGDVTVVREVPTTDGGRGLTASLRLLPSKDEHSRPTMVVHYYHDNVLIGSKPLAESIPISAGSTSNLDIELNDPNAQVIQNFSISMHDRPWGNNDVIITPPEGDIECPPGYIEIKKGDNLTDTIKNALTNAALQEVNIFVQPTDTIYTINSGIVLTKSLHLMAAPKKNGDRPKVNIGAIMAINGTTATDKMKITGCDFTVTSNTAYLFQFESTNTFTLDSLVLDNCTFGGDNFQRGLFRKNGGDQTINHLLINNCVIITNGAYASVCSGAGPGNLFNDFKMTNSTVALKNTGNYKMLMEGLNSVTTPMSFTYSNCTFYDNNSTKRLELFVMNGTPVTTTVSLNVSKCLFSSAQGDASASNSYGYRAATTLGTISFTDNYCVSGWTIRNSFTPAPIPDAMTNVQLFTNPSAFDFTINPSSTVYQNSIGDPRWIK